MAVVWNWQGSLHTNYYCAALAESRQVPRAEYCSERIWLPNMAVPSHPLSFLFLTLFILLPFMILSSQLLPKLVLRYISLMFRLLLLLLWLRRCGLPTLNALSTSKQISKLVYGPSPPPSCWPLSQRRSLITQLSIKSVSRAGLYLKASQSFKRVAA
jgi:hypothetical protein